MSDPYRSAKAGDAILAETWNQMQRDVRDHIRSHTHIGEQDAGAKLTGASIDKSSTLEVDKVIAVSTTADALTISGATNLKGGVAVTGAASFSGALSITGSLDLSQGARSGSLHRTAVLGAYITGDFAADSGIEFRHTSGTQGIGFGCNTIYATGANPNQELTIKARGTSAVKIDSPLTVTGNGAIAGSLSVTGSLTIGAHYAVSAPGQATHTIWGFVADNGTIASGKGFTVTKEGAGTYRVTFAAAFATRPCVVATLCREGGSLADKVLLYEVNVGNCLIKTGDQFGTASDRQFSFIAIGS